MIGPSAKSPAMLRFPRLAARDLGGPAITNMREVCITWPYRWFKAIGPRGSFVDRGLTFGTTTRRGVCVLLREPVPGLAPDGLLRHPGITLTLAEPDRFASSLHRRAGLE